MKCRIGMNRQKIVIEEFARMCEASGADMIIANSEDIGVLHRIMEGKNVGTLFVGKKDENFDLSLFVNGLHK